MSNRLETLDRIDGMEQMASMTGRWLYFASGLLAICATLLYIEDDLLMNIAWLDRAFTSHSGTQDLGPDVPAAWDQLYHLGGNSPWIPKTTGLASSNISVPDGCRVDQVHMMSRYAERYPTAKVGKRMRDLFLRIYYHDQSLNGSLSIANDWELFTHESPEHLENLVSTGPYAGTLEAFETGVKLRTRYGHLLDPSQLAGQNVTIWTSGSPRVEETARYFGLGFFGLDSLERQRHTYGHLEVIPETPERGADTLTPGDTCLNYANDVDDYGHGYGARMLSEFQSTYIPAIAARFAQENPSMPFSVDEVYTMQEICGFETIAKGSSAWCDVFTHEEWESFEYARDLLHYYRAGPGNPYGATMGWLWLNSTLNLLQSPEKRKPQLFFSFVHDGDIIPMLAALDLFPQSPDLPTTHVPHNRTWRTSDVTPMGGRVILERLSCEAPQDCWNNPLYPNHVYCEPPRYESFVRVNVNDGIVAIPGYDGGPGHSCPMGDFAGRIRRMGGEVGEFGDVCGLGPDAAREITFLHQ